MRFIPWSDPPPPPLAPPPLIDGTVAAAAIALFVLLAVVAVRFSRRVALQRSLAQRALRKRAERDAQRERAADAGLDWSGLLRWAAPLNPQTPPEAVVELSATALLAAMEARQLSAEYVMRCFVARAMAAGRALQCNAEERFEAAVAEAAACDAERARGGPVRGLLHGLPISVKDQLDMAGYDSTCGLACRTFAPSQGDALLLALARGQGAIPFVRTAVPQLLMLPETFSAAWGTTCNPHDLSRTCGGSTGGEGALIAARGSPLGIGTDVGGSIRLPAAMCGICGFKPTNDRLSQRGVATPRRERASGQKEVRASGGPMGRSVADLELLMQAWCTPALYEGDPTLPRMPWDRAAYLRPINPGGAARLRFGVLRADGWFAAAPALARALEETVQAVRRAGHEVVEVPAEAVCGAEAVMSYVSISSADGAMRGFIEALEGEALHPCYAFLHTVSRVPAALRPALAAVLRLLGERRKAALFVAGGRKSAYDYWQAVLRRDAMRRRFLDYFQAQQLDALLSPPLALPAVPHLASQKLAAFLCASSFLWNNYNCPAGTLPVTTVRDTEEAYPAAGAPGADSCDALAAAALRGTAGLPAGVQVVGLPWRDEATLGAMAEVERCLAAAGRGAAAVPMPPHPPLPRSAAGAAGGAQ